MLSLAAKMDPRFSWAQVEQAILAIPLQRFEAARKFGDCAEDGLKIARATMSDDVRRELQKLIATPIEATPRDRGT